MNITKLLLRFNTRCSYRPNYFHTLIKRSLCVKIEVNTNEDIISKNSVQIGSIQIDDEKSLIKPCNEDISSYAPLLKSSFNLAAYVDKSPTLQNFVDLGVNLFKIEKKREACELILKLNFDKDVKKYLLFLKDIGIDVDLIGDFISTNPFIFKEDIDNLQTRINYLRSKKFDKDMIIRILTKNPFWLMFSTQRIDNRLGYFQKSFELSGNEVRHLTTRQPKLITYNLLHVKSNTFTIKEEMGFTQEEIKTILLNKPRLWMMNKDSILDRFLYAHKEMNLTTEYITLQPEILLSRKHKTKERHEFLKTLGKDQYNPLEPNYVSMLGLVSGSDAEFCEKVAKSSVQTFNMFIRSM